MDNGIRGRARWRMLVNAGRKFGKSGEELKGKKKKRRKKKEEE